jgi:hypothetical protein
MLVTFLIINGVDYTLVKLLYVILFSIISFNCFAEIVKEYYPNNVIKLEYHLKNGKKEGLSKFYYENGNIGKEAHYKQGKEDGTTYGYYKGGSIKEKREYTAGKLDGVVNGYYESGNIKYENFYSNDIPIGHHKWYYENGELKSEFKYSNNSTFNGENGFWGFAIFTGLIFIGAIYYLDSKPKHNNPDDKSIYSFAILKKETFIKAIDLERNIQSDDLINNYISMGYKKIAVLEGYDEDDVIEKYKVSIEKSPLDKANETIRSANQRISELKEENEILYSVIDDLKSKIEKSSYQSTNQNDFENYQWLGFDSMPTKAELKSKYKKLNLIYHPDKGGCGQVMSKINEAYNSLLKVVS